MTNNITYCQGIRFNYGDGLLQKIDARLVSRSVKPLVIFTPNPEQIVLAREKVNFKNCLNSSDINLIDGIGVVWFLRWRHGLKVRRQSGVEFAWELLEKLNHSSAKVFLLGAKKGVNKRLRDKLTREFPNLQIKGQSGGKVSEDGVVKGRIIKIINDFQPDLLLVAFGAPKQELFVCRYRQQLKVKVVMVVGGAFDYWAGVVPRAPKWLRKIGLEWLFRLIIEPWRIKRQLRLVRFVFWTKSDS